MRREHPRRRDASFIAQRHRFVEFHSRVARVFNPNAAHKIDSADPRDMG